MGHGKSLGSFDGPPIFFVVHGWATKQKPMLIIYYIKILIIKVNKTIQIIKCKCKWCYWSQYFVLYKKKKWSNTRITANTTNWRAAQYRNWWWMCWSIVIGWWMCWNYVCQCSAGVYLQCSYRSASLFFIIKVYFPNLDWVRGSWNKFGKIRWALKFLSTS
jgi:hypothetical protein